MTRRQWIRSHHVVRGLIGLGVIASVWFISTAPWGIGTYQLLMFSAPGAVLAMGAAWISHARTPDEWTWRRARHSAIIGAIVLPPVLALMVAVEGNARPERLLVGFVYSAWVAILGGAAVGVFRGPPRRSK